MSADDLGPPLASCTVPMHGPTQNDRLHWAARARQVKALKEAVQWALKAQGVRPLHLDRAILRVTLGYPPRARRLDYDNAVASVKAGVDSLVVYGLLRGDSPRHLEWLPVEQVRSEQPGKWTRLDIWEVKGGSSASH